MYRADLYVQQCREEQEQEMQRRASDSDMKADSSGDDGWQAPADEVEQPPGLGLDEEDESPAPATPTYDFRESYERLSHERPRSRLTALRTLPSSRRHPHRPAGDPPAATASACPAHPPSENG